MKKILFIASLFFSCCPLFGQNQLEDFLLDVESLNDSIKVDSAIKKARVEVINRSGETALPFAYWALKEAQTNQLQDLIPKARFYLASAHDDLGDYDSSSYHYDQALTEMKGTAHENWDIHVYINSIEGYTNTGQYEKALKSAYNVLNHYEEIGNTLEVAFSYTEIGYVYDRMKEFKEAIKWHRKSLEVFQEAKDDFATYFVKGRLGIAFDDLGIYDSAHLYNQQTLNFHRAEKDSFNIAQVSSNIGNTYIKQKNWAEALSYLQQAYQLGLKHGDGGSLGIAAINLGNVNTQLGNYDEAKEYLKKGLSSVRSWGGKKFESEAYFRLYELFEQKREFDSSLYYFKKFEALEDSLYSLEKTQQIANMKTRYDTEKKEQQILLQEISLQEKESKLESRRRTIFALILLSILIVALSAAGYNRIKARKNAEMQERVIEEQERGLKAIFNAQEEERKRISKELHDGIGQQLSGLKMAFQKLGSSIKDQFPEKVSEMEKLSEIISESADEVRSISHQMMPRALVELGLIEALEDMLSKSLGIGQIEYVFEHYGINERLDNSKEVSLYRISQELINNIIKHSGATMVNVQLFKNGDKVILIVEDNGKGINESSSKGHGLMNIKNRLNTINGEVNFEPSPNSGTLATIRIPL